MHLGVDPVGDKEFLWLAEEALCAPLPPHWTEHMDAEKGVYYYNSNTGESVWGAPPPPAPPRTAPRRDDRAPPPPTLRLSENAAGARARRACGSARCLTTRALAPSQSTLWTTTTAGCSSRCTRTRRR